MVYNKIKGGYSTLDRVVRDRFWEGDIYTES